MTNCPPAINANADVLLGGGVAIFVGCKVQKDGEHTEAVRAARQSLAQIQPCTKSHLDLPLTILYHTLPLTPSSESVAFTFVRKEKQ